MPIRKSKLRSIIVLTIAVAPLRPLHAQDDCGGACKINSNLAMVLNMPVSSTSQVAGTGWGAVGGVGYNFNERNAIIGEFMWNRMYPSGTVLQPLQRPPSQSSGLSGNSNLYALTGNYRYELRGRMIGTYLIGGGGWYFRKNWLSREVTSGPATVCTPAWLWWGFTCASGTVTANQTLATSTTNVWGVNAGIGFTVRVGEAPYRLYTEAGYHYAPTKGISTQFMAITVGIRY
jgi:hypothetical protein